MKISVIALHCILVKLWNKDLSGVQGFRLKLQNKLIYAGRWKCPGAMELMHARTK
jgi:hypothetical protein